MAVTKRTVSFDPEVRADLERIAATEQMEVSTDLEAVAAGTQRRLIIVNV